MPNKKYITLENLRTYRQEDKAELDAALLLKQDALVSGTNIKTVNGNSLLGAGDLDLSDLEIVVYQNTAPLTAAQLAKAQAGKLAVYKDGRFYHESYAGNSLINYSCFEAGHEISVSVNVNDIITIKEYKIILDTSTGMLDYTGYMPVSGIGDYANNFLAADAAPSASGKKLLREPLLVRTQGMVCGDAYDATTTYSAGDVVIYQNELYEANQDIPVAEAWTAAHWDKTDVLALMDAAIAAAGPDDQTASALLTLTASEWSDLKDDHYLATTVASFPAKDETFYKLSIDGTDHVVRFSKNSASQAKALFLVEEEDQQAAMVGHYELTMFLQAVSGGSTRAILRCATIYAEPIL